MSSRVTLTLRDDVLQRAEQLSLHTGRPVADVLIEAIDATLDPLGPLPQSQPVRKLSDRELLAVADSKMTRAQHARMSALLERQREGMLTPSERTELMAMNQVYQEGLLRKAQAIAEAARRGLRSPRIR
jgi:hypothetical protein